MRPPDGSSADNGPVVASRRPIDPGRVRALLANPARWSIEQVAVTGSTNADLAAMGRAARSGQVLTAEEQLTGRGRSGRDWYCPSGAGLMFSVLLRSSVPADRRGWFGAVLGVAIVRALDRVGGVRARLKWPNDVLIDGAKCAGILGEAAEDAVIVGAGINVSLVAEELPRDDATSLLLAGGAPDRLDRAAMLAGILNEFGELLDRWVAAGGDVEGSGLRAEYRTVCATVGSRVRLLLPGGAEVVGEAVDVAPDGSLVVEGSGVRRAYTAADVIHLRPQ
jgi:BirA family transcriptional regulator, biotin operon repressor / biotin---[acetyl-CoA-carboxylase] ligase